MYCFCALLVKFVNTTRLRRLYVYLYGDVGMTRVSIEIPFATWFSFENQVKPKIYLLFSP